ncbi:MAG: MlaD family protein [Pseudomonadota bacterium]
MTNIHQVEQHAADAKLRPRASFSIVWIVPIVALLIGGWLTYKAITEKGPSITITFATAEGLEAGKTKIKYRDVEIGQVEQINLSQDVSQVEVTAQLVKGSEQYLTDMTKFWVVRAQIRGGSVSGLSTVISGAYIGFFPSKEGEPCRTFKGLEVPPVVTLGQPGRHFRLTTDTLGSLDIGSPVYYRKIQVGQVVGYQYNDDGNSVTIQFFIEAPHHRWVTTNTRFWNASGIDVSLSDKGLNVDVQSLISIIKGGISFDVPKGMLPGEVAAENTTFFLYDNQAGIQEKKYSIREYWMLLFDESVRGLNVGSSVELHGIKIGEVVEFNLEFNYATREFIVPVMVAIEPERIRIVNRKEPDLHFNDKDESFLKWLVEERGLRAQLNSSNILTGQLRVNLDFHPRAPRQDLSHYNGYPVVPTAAGSFGQIQDGLVRFIGRLDKVPVEKIGNDLQLMLKQAEITLKQIGGLATTLDTQTAPALQATIDECQKLVKSLEGTVGVELQKTLIELQKTLGVELQNTLVELQKNIGENSPLKYNFNKTLEELSLTLRSFRELTSILEQQPQSIIYGKDKEKQKRE